MIRHQCTIRPKPIVGDPHYDARVRWDAPSDTGVTRSGRDSAADRHRTRGVRVVGRRMRRFGHAATRSPQVPVRATFRHRGGLSRVRPGPYTRPEVRSFQRSPGSGGFRALRSWRTGALGPALAVCPAPSQARATGWTATLHPRWGAPGDDKADHRPRRSASAGPTADPFDDRSEYQMTPNGPSRPVRSTPARRPTRPPRPGRCRSTRQRPTPSIPPSTAASCSRSRNSATSTPGS